MKRAIGTCLALILATSLGACSSEDHCRALGERLCEGAPDNCAKARSWLDEQIPGAEGTGAQRESADVACESVLAHSEAVSTYRQRFESSLRSSAKTPSPAAVAPDRSPPPGDPSVKEQIEEAGEVIEATGEAGRKLGEAIDKIEGALDQDDKQ